MRVGERIAERRKAVGLSQTRLARSAGLSQATIGKLEAGISSGSSHLHRIARALETTPAYLAGEIDDPAEGATPPPPATVQLVTMQVALPPEGALEQMFLGLLLSLEAPNAAELAPELAKLLPTGLQTLRAPLRYVATDSLDAAVDEPADQPREAPARRRA